jgi:hypothetical protein
VVLRFSEDEGRSATAIRISKDRIYAEGTYCVDVLQIPHISHFTFDKFKDESTMELDAHLLKGFRYDHSRLSMALLLTELLAHRRRK